VARQCFDKLKPLAITADEAQSIRASAASYVAREATTLDESLKTMERELRALQDKLDRLTHGYLDGLIDEDSYRHAKEALVVEKTDLKRKTERVRKTRAN